MAINTISKRFGMLGGMCSPVVSPMHGVLTGVVTPRDRAQFLHLYGGNGFDAPGGAVAFRNYMYYEKLMTQDQI